MQANNIFNAPHGTWPGKNKVFDSVPEPDHKPIIQLRPGAYPEACDEIEQILKESSIGIYRYGATLITVVWDEVRVAGDQTDIAPRHHLVTSPNLLNLFARAAIFQKYSKQDEEWVRCHPPTDLANQYLAKGEWDLPPLLGVVTAPTIRHDGTILDIPGYDHNSRLIYDPRGISFPEIPEYPTVEQARAAIKTLLKPLRYYNFVDDADRSVALSAVLTACIRRSIRRAPMHAFDAPIRGSGKSNLVDYASVIATGHRAPVITVGEPRYGGTNELEKRLGAAILAGDTIIALDNVERELNGEILNQMLTQTKIKVRILGTSQQPEMPTVATVFATGNNIQIAGDLTRRTLISRVNPHSERPELKEYPFNPVELAIRARPILVTAALTLIRAYLTQKRRIKISPLGSYEKWCYFVREPLVWVGEADPVQVMERIHVGDPILNRLAVFCTAWAQTIGFNETVYTREIITAALKKEYSNQGDEILKNPELYDAVKVIAGDKISPDRLGCYLRTNIDREVTIDINDHTRYLVRLMKAKESTIGAKWQLEKLKDYNDPPF